MAQRTTETHNVGEGSASAQNPRQADSNISAAPSSSRGQTRRPGRKTKGQKRRERQAREDEEEGFISSDDPANYYARPKVSAAEHIASLPSIITTAAPLDPVNPVIESGSRPPEMMETDDAVTGNVIPSLQLQPRGDSSSSTSSLLPPSRDEASSASSSRPLKRGRDSPSVKRRREHQPPPADEVLKLRRDVATLQVQLQQAQMETRHLRNQLQAEYDAGFLRGQAQGFREAQEMNARGELATPSLQPARHSRRQVTPDAHAGEAENLRLTMQKSRRDAQPGPPGMSTPGAGPSRSGGPKGRGEPRPTQSSVNPGPHGAELNTRPYTIPVIKKFGVCHADPSKVKWQGLAHIPLPTECPPAQGNTVTVSGPATPPKAEDAKSYLELWAGFASGKSVPEVFTRLHQTSEHGTTDSDLRDAVEGYGLIRRITIANTAGLKKESVNAFLILLTALAREMDLIGTRGIWSETLKKLAPGPVDNWAALTAAFTCHPQWARADFGIQFHPPQLPSQPWEITTSWHRDNFMRVLLEVRPSVQSLWCLALYGDLFVRTRWAQQPMPEVTLKEQRAGMIYAAPFLGTPARAAAFLADDKDVMEVDPSGVTPTPFKTPGNTGA